MIIIEQQRAKNALDQVKKLEKESDEFKKSYRSYVDRIGPAIVMNGLGQALATERAAAGSKHKDHEKAHYRLYCNIKAWLCNRPNSVYGGTKDLDSADLLKTIMDNDESMYLRAQAETLAWLEWHKKFCRASLPKAGENEE